MLRRHSSVSKGARDNNSFAPARRFGTAAEFASVVQAPKARSIRAARQLLSVGAAWSEAVTDVNALCPVRFGVTVGRRHARRAVDRALVKRIVREACRHHASALEQCAAMAGVRIDVMLRLKSPLVDAGGKALAMKQWRRQLRVEADALLEQVLTELALRHQR